MEKSMTIWEILNINITTDTKEIRRAYSEMSKVYHPEREPEKFQMLYQAYHAALDYARENQDNALDFWGENAREEQEIVSQNESTTETKFENSNSSAFEQLERTQIPEDELQDIAGPENVQDSFYEDKFQASVPAVVQESLECFVNYFSSPGKKDWKKFMAKPEFLRVQFDEQFALVLAGFLERQTLYVPEKLPFDLVKELFFCYYPYMEDRGRSVFEDGFTKLFELLYRNVRIEYVVKRYTDPKLTNERAKYIIYYNLYKNVMKGNGAREISVWNTYIPEVNREFYVTQGVKSSRDNLIFAMLAFLIQKSSDLSNEIYAYLIRELNLVQVKGSSRWEIMKPIYCAIEAKGIQIEEQRNAKAQRVEEIRTLMGEVDKLHKQRLTEEDRPMVRAFFHSDLYEKYKLDEEFISDKLMIYMYQANLFSNVFLEEYLAFYDEVYAQTGSLVGKVLYNYISSQLKSNPVTEDGYTEIIENKKEWVLCHFFEESFTRVWESNKKGMKIVYRSRLEEHLKNLADQCDYEMELWDDGHLYAIKDGSNYVFSYDKVKEKAILSMEEYYHILEELLDLYMGRYFCTSSEKNKWNELRERAGNSYGNYRN